MEKKILITGAGGFIGSHLTEAAVEKGFKVKAFVRYNSMGTLGALDGSKYLKDLEIIKGDIRDFDSVHSAMKNCEMIFHLAALIGIPYSYVSPLAYIKTNVEGTYNILESARIYGTSQVIITSTSETYGSAQYVPIDEKHHIVGQSPYSASKIGADQLAISYYRSFNLPVKIVRPFNTYGPRQSSRAIIPTIITQILNGKPMINLGNTHPTRDFTFVKDTAQAFLEIAKSSGLTGEVTNVGMNEEISIEDLSDLIARIAGTKFTVNTDSQRIRPPLSEVERLVCNNEKILKNTAWKPTYSLQKGLAETMEWLRENIARFKTSDYSI